MSTRAELLCTHLPSYALLCVTLTITLNTGTHVTLASAKFKPNIVFQHPNTEEMNKKQTSRPRMWPIETVAQ